MLDREQFIADMIQLEDLDGSIKMIAEIIGIEKAKELIMYVGGDNHYIPSIRKYQKTILKRYLLDLGISPKSIDKIDLVRKFGLCRKSIDEVVNEVSEARKNQLKLF